MVLVGRIRVPSLLIALGGIILFISVVVQAIVTNQRVTETKRAKSPKSAAKKNVTTKSFELTEFITPIHTNYSEPEKQLCQADWKNSFISQDAKQNRQATRQDILTIHVGKTCGTSINNIFKKNKIPHDAIHVKSPMQSDIRAHKYIFISIREPISRIISSFNFHHPSSKGIVPGGGLTPKGDKMFYKCFNTVEEYAQNLTENTACGNLARKGYGHGRLGLCHYVGGLRELLKTKQVFVIEQENCYTQLLEALKLVGRPIAANSTTATIAAPIRVNHKSSLPHTLTESATIKLKKHLESLGEYDLYYELKEKAVKVQSRQS